MKGEKQPMQADGSGTRGEPPSTGRGGAGDSGGGPYPNPHRGKTSKHGALDHGRQTELDRKLPGADGD